MYNFKGIIFDLDGTIMDSEIFHYNCWNRTLKNYGLFLDHQDYMRNYGGIPVLDNARVLVKKYNIDVQPEVLAMQREDKAYKSIMEQPIQYMPFAKIALDYFKNRHYPLYLVTGSPRNLVNQVLRKNNLEDYFEFTITENEVENSKPHSECYFKAIELSGFKSSELVVFEDTRSGVLAAKGAQLSCWAIQRNNELKQKVKMADLIFSDFSEALSFFVAQRNQS